MVDKSRGSGPSVQFKTLWKVLEELLNQSRKCKNNQADRVTRSASTPSKAPRCIMPSYAILNQDQSEYHGGVCCRANVDPGVWDSTVHT